MKNKKGVKPMTAIFLLILIALGGVGIYGYSTFFGKAPQQIVPTTTITTDGVKTTTQECTDPLQIGKPATLAITALDYSQDIPSQVAVTEYTFLNGQIVLQAGQSTLTTAEVTENVQTCSSAKVIAFQPTDTFVYYGIPVDLNIGAGQNPKVQLAVLRANSNGSRFGEQPKVDFYYQNAIKVPGYGGQVVGQAVSANISLGISQSDSFDKLEISQNTTNKALQIGAFVFDQASTGGIDTISLGTGSIDRQSRASARSSLLPSIAKTTYSINSGANKYTYKRLSRTSKADFIIELAEPVMLMEYDKLITGSMKVKATSAGCATGEQVNMTIVDVSHFITANNQLGLGVEKDDASSSEVGTQDFVYTFVCD